MSLVVRPEKFLIALNLVIGFGDPTLMVGILILYFLTIVIGPITFGGLRLHALEGFYPLAYAKHGPLAITGLSPLALSCVVPLA